MAITEFNYNPTNWDTNKAITPSRLNKIEQSLYKVGNILKEISKSLEALDNKIVGIQGSIAQEYNKIVADAKAETEQVINNYDETITSVIADYKGDMDNRFIALDNYKTEVISAGAAAADNFLIGRGFDLEDIKAWRIDKEAKDAERDLWQNGVDTWKGDTTIRIDHQNELISGIDSIANEAKTTATAAANTATSAANTATTAANNVESKIWAGNQNLTNSFNNLLNSEGARSIMNKNAKIAIGRTFGMNPSDDDDIDTETLKNSLKAATTTSVSELGFAKTDDVDAAIANTEVRLNKTTNQKLGTVFGLTVNDDDDVNMTELQTQLQNFAGSTLLTANIITDATEGNQTLTQWLNNKQAAESTNFTNIQTALSQLATDIADIRQKLVDHASDTDAHNSTSESDNLFDDAPTYDGIVMTPVTGFTPTIIGKK